jgi:hypothetical protein
MPMSLETTSLWSDDDGEVVGYRFVPVNERN